MFTLSRATYHTDVFFAFRNKSLVGSVLLDPSFVPRFALYRDIGRRSHSYFEQLSADDLQLLVLQHEANMATLDTQEQMLVLDICTRRYLDAVDRSIRDVARDAKLDSVRTEASIMQAKILAIDSDRKTLETLLAQVNLATEKASSSIAQFELEENQADYDIAQVSVEASKQKLNVSRAKLDLLNSQQKVAQYQVQIVELAYQKANIAVQLATINADIIQFQNKATAVDSQIAEIDAQAVSLRSRISEFSAKGIRAQAGIIDYEYKGNLNSVHAQEYQAEVETLSAQLTTLDARRQTVEAQRNEILSHLREIDSKVADVEYQIAKIDVDIANMQIQEAEQALTEGTMRESEAAVTEARAQAESWPERVSALQDKLNFLISFVIDGDLYGKMLAADMAVIDGQIESLNSKTGLDVLTTQGDGKISAAEAALRSKLATLRAVLAEGTSDAEIASTKGQGKIWDAKLSGSATMKYSKIDAAKTIAKANVGYELIHSIGGK